MKVRALHLHTGTLTLIVHVALRVEWLRARARATRYQEEVLLVQEEQRRTLVSLDQYALEWDQRAHLPSVVSECPLVRSGLSAYAMEQAAFYRAIAARYRNLWRLGVTHRVLEGEVDTGREADTADSTLHFADDLGDDDEERIDMQAGDSDVE